MSEDKRLYRHYKGHVYQLLNDAVYFESGHNANAVTEHRDNRYVTYSDPDTGQCWLRPYHEFFGSVYVKEEGKHVPRFARVPDAPT